MPADFWSTASPAMLRRRAELLRRLRAFFDSRDFVEVETPLLSHDTVVDRHLDPFAVTVFGDPRQPAAGPRLWLQTSPEFAMKRLLTRGDSGAEPLTAIYQVTKAFRGGGEAGPRHNPEFTLAEWYRVGDDYAAGMQLLADLAEALLAAGPAERLTYREAFVRFAGVDPFGPWTLADCGLAAGELPADAERELVLDYLLTTRVEPNLGKNSPAILYDYPANQAALAQVRSGDPPLAERFELYYRGLELANGYHELLDAAALRERNEANNRLRAADGKPALPVESRLLAAMEHGLPACAGCALGFDRLVMAATGGQSIAEVLAFPIDRA